MTTLVNPALATQLGVQEDFNADACMNCGVCTAICPMEMQVQPRQLFRWVMLGMESKLEEHREAIYSCLLCRMCEENCPRGVHISENVRALRHHINRTVYGL